MDAVLIGKCRVALKFARRLWSACEGNQRRADKAFLQASLHGQSHERSYSEILRDPVAFLEVFLWNAVRHHRENSFTVGRVS